MIYFGSWDFCCHFSICFMDGAHGKTSPDLSLAQKWTILCRLMQYYDFDRKMMIADGSKQVAARFGVAQRTVRSLLLEYSEKLSNGDVYPDLSPLSKKVCGVQLHLTDEMTENIVNLHFMTEGGSGIELFCEQYLIEFGVSISRSSMERYLIHLGASDKRIYLAPLLSDKQRMLRLKFILGLIEHADNGHYRFIKQFRIHIDEKWFFVQELQQKVRYLPCEVRPRERTVHHKSHIEKTMFLAAIGRPETFKIDGVNHVFDGKIGIFPFAKLEPAKRNSKNRKKGEMVMVNIPVDAEAYHDVMTREDGLLDTLKKKLPFLKGMHVIIQHDGAKPHYGKGNLVKLNEFGSKDG